MTDERRVRPTTRVSDADQRRATDLAPESNPSERRLLVTGVGAKHESTLEASISVFLETEFPQPHVNHFLMTPAAAHQLAKSLRQAVKDYLRYFPDP